MLAEVKRQWQREKEQRKGVTLLHSWENMVLPEAIWCLGSSPPKPRCWADKLCCLPKPRSHSFWSTLKFSGTWFSPFSPAVLKLVGGCLCSHTATTRGNEGSFVDWHLICSGSVQWSPQISPGPDWACVSAFLLLHSLRQLTKRSGLCGQTSKPSDEEWRCYFFFLLLQHMLAVC